MEFGKYPTVGFGKSYSIGSGFGRPTTGFGSGSPSTGFGFGSPSMGVGFGIPSSKQPTRYVTDAEYEDFFRETKSRWVTMVITGYDPSLPEDDALRTDLTDHFRSCGQIFRVDFDKDPHNNDDDGHRCALIQFYGEDIEDKVLERCGTEMRGRKLVANTFPPLELVVEHIPFGSDSFA